MKYTPIKRLANGEPRYTVRDHHPRSPRGGCKTYDVYDRLRGVVVHGPTTISAEAAEYCGRFSMPADLALAPLPAEPMQMEML